MVPLAEGLKQLHDQYHVMSYLTTQIDCGECGYSGVVVHGDDVLPTNSHPHCPSCGGKLAVGWGQS